MKITLILVTFLICSTSRGQIPEKISKKMGPFPVLFLDSVETKMSILEEVNPMNISNIEILIPKTAKRSLGERGGDGAIYVTTVKFAKLNYWKFLSDNSNEYLKRIPNPDSDTSAIYILNDSVLTKNPSGSLFLLNKRNFKRLNILDQPELEEKYGVADKQFGVIIKSKKVKRGKNS